MLPSLHCKPYHVNTIFEKQSASGLMTIRSLDLYRDLDTVYNWVNQDYSKKFWQMDGSREFLFNTYYMILENPHAHSFIILLDGEPVGQIDLYQVLSDELKNHLSATSFDCGLHLLMLPPRKSRKGLSIEVLKTFIEYYFSFSLSACLYAEPDINNRVANLLARKTGFQFEKIIQLSTKTANLYKFPKPVL